jgi:hypothetical protein
MKIEYVYIFNGNSSIFPAGVFQNKELAISWIKDNLLSGVLNQYPLNVSLYDWAIAENLFTIKNENQKKPGFIEKFTCASIEHWHFENGEIR